MVVTHEGSLRCKIALAPAPSQSGGEREPPTASQRISLAGNPAGSVALKKLGVKAADKEEEFTFSTEGKSTTDMGWATQVFNFTATGAETTLELYTLMNEDPNCGPALDHVSVVQDKE